MGTCTFTWKWLLHEKKRNKDPERFAHIIEKASGSCTHLKNIISVYAWHFPLSCSQSCTLHWPCPWKQPHGPNPAQRNHQALPIHSPTGLPQQHLFSKVTPNPHIDMTKLRPSKALLFLCEDKVQWPGRAPWGAQRSPAPRCRHLLRWHHTKSPRAGSCTKLSTTGQMSTGTTSPASILKHGFALSGEKGSALTRNTWKEVIYSPSCIHQRG